MRATSNTETTWSPEKHEDPTPINAGPSRLATPTGYRANVGKSMKNGSPLVLPTTPTVQKLRLLQEKTKSHKGSQAQLLGFFLLQEIFQPLCLRRNQRDGNQALDYEPPKATTILRLFTPEKKKKTTAPQV